MQHETHKCMYLFSFCPEHKQTFIDKPACLKESYYYRFMQSYCWNNQNTDQ